MKLFIIRRNAMVRVDNPRTVSLGGTGTGAQDQMVSVGGEAGVVTIHFATPGTAAEACGRIIDAIRKALPGIARVPFGDIIVDVDLSDLEK